MASLKEVKSRIASVQSTQQITKAMKMVAAAKLRKSQDKITQIRPFVKKLDEVLMNVSAAGTDGPAWYNKPRQEKKILIVCVSSDRGLCGSFNSSVFKQTVKVIQDKYSAQESAGNVTVLPIGKKGFEFFTKRNYKVNDQYWNLFHQMTYGSVAAAADYIMQSFQDGTYDQVEVIYNEFKNVATQILRTVQYLPISSGQGSTGKVEKIDYIYQPNQEEIIMGLIPKSLRIQLYKFVLDSNASENGARMTAMDKATDNAGELIKELKLTYNRTRQAAITKEILEIVAGAEALKGT